jgi:hypothetical protein
MENLGSLPIEIYQFPHCLPAMTRRRSNKNSGRKSGSQVVAGSQELRQITLGTPSGSFLGGQIPLIPTFEPTSRLGVIALLYSQYTIEVSRVSFVSQTTTNTSGRLCLAWTYDTLDADPVNCHQILQISKSRMCPLWKNMSTTMTRGSPEKRRFASIDGPSYVGLTPEDKQIYTPATLIFGSDGSAQSGLTVGSLIWHYRIRFYNPNVPTGIVSTSFQTIVDPEFQPSPPEAPGVAAFTKSLIQV